MAVAAALHNFLRARTFNPVDTFDIKLDWRIMERLNGSEEVAKTKARPFQLLYCSYMRICEWMMVVKAQLDGYSKKSSGNKVGNYWNAFSAWGGSWTEFSKPPRYCCACIYLNQLSYGSMSGWLTRHSVWISGRLSGDEASFFPHLTAAAAIS